MASVHVETYRFAVELDADADASTPIGAKTSIAHALQELSRQPIADRVEVSLTQREGRYARVTVRFDDGAESSAEATEPRSETDVRGKFRRLAGERADAIEAAVDALPSAGDVRDLSAALA